ncbi:hypothetical protein EVAR_63986_1 [Eumeta japonica]|uniref:Ubiquitin-like protease family profile domain-containing protein n=1 Tax=Eumeta variegata TaxID=151549 RepID=A0A4C1ZIT2_EUMVA|nr:hypothetical protein EVAR_63986_1 [Eumeta japonica]
MNAVLSYVRRLVGFPDKPIHQVGNKRDRTDDDVSSDEETPVLKRLKQLRKTNFPELLTNCRESERNEELKPSKMRIVPIQIEKQPSTSTPIENNTRERIIPIKLHGLSENGLKTTSRRLQMHSPVRPVVAHAIIDDDDEPEVTVIESKPQRKVNKASPKYYIDLDEIDNVAGQQDEDDVIFLEKVNSPPSYKSYKYFVPKTKSPHLNDNNTSPGYTLYRKVNEQNNLSDSLKTHNKSKTLGGISKTYKRSVTPIPNWMQSIKTCPSSSKTSKNNFTNLNGNVRSALHEIFNLEEKQNYRDLIKRATNTSYRPLTTTKTSEILSLVDDFASFRSTQKAQRNALNNLKLVEKGITKSKELETTNEYDPITVASISSSDSDVEVIASGSSTTSSVKINPVNSFKDSLCDKPIVANDWLLKLDSKYKKRHQENQQKLSDAKREAEIISKVNYEQKIAQIEHKLKYELSIPECLIEETTTVELPELTADQEKLVNRALGPGPPGQLLVEKFNLRIHRRDLQTLSGLNWLNDEVINFYMNLLMQRCEERKDLPKVYATNTFFYPKLMQSGQAGLRRWTRKLSSCGGGNIKGKGRPSAARWRGKQPRLCKEKGVSSRAAADGETRRRGEAAHRRE